MSGEADLHTAAMAVSTTWDATWGKVGVAELENTMAPLIDTLRAALAAATEPPDDERPSGYVMTLEAHRKRMDEQRADLATKMMRQRGVAVGLLDDLIAWFGAPDWMGPQMPVPLARRIAEFLEDGRG